jgi:hypothetical protein
MRLASLACLAFFACGPTRGPSSFDGIRDVAECSTVAPFCSYALSAPDALAGDLDGYFGPDGVDCVPPDGDPSVFRFAFGFGAHRAVVRAPRPIPLGDALVPAALVDGSNDCGGWLRVERDVPDWSLELDLTCDGAHLVGWFGGAWPTEWR